MKNTILKILSTLVLVTMLSCANAVVTQEESDANFDSETWFHGRWLNNGVGYDFQKDQVLYVGGGGGRDVTMPNHKYKSVSSTSVTLEAGGITIEIEKNGNDIDITQQGNTRTYSRP